MGVVSLVNCLRFAMTPRYSATTLSAQAELIFSGKA